MAEIEILALDREAFLRLPLLIIFAFERAPEALPDRTEGDAPFGTFRAGH